MVTFSRVHLLIIVFYKWKKNGKQKANNVCVPLIVLEVLTRPDPRQCKRRTNAVRSWCIKNHFWRRMGVFSPITHGFLRYLFRFGLNTTTVSASAIESLSLCWSPIVNTMKSFSIQNYHVTNNISGQTLFADTYIYMSNYQLETPQKLETLMYIRVTHNTCNKIQ